MSEYASSRLATPTEDSKAFSRVVARLDALVKEAILDGAFPGACYAVWKNGELSCGAAGSFTYDPTSPPIDLDTIWDLASLSKVVATTTSVMILVQEGLLDIDQPVNTVIPEFGVKNKGAITFRNLLVHDSGLVAFRQYHLICQTREQVLQEIYDEELTYETGTDTVYSDLSMILAAEAITRITNQTLDEFAKERIFGPLSMDRTGYFRRDQATFLTPVSRTECAPTESIEPWRKELRSKVYGEDADKVFGPNPRYIQGEVHDPTATVLGGVAGHAGLFSTIADISTFLIHFMNNRSSAVQPGVWNSFTKRQNPKSSRGLGWDTKSPLGSSAGTKFGPKSYGHTGYTGTSIWIDPEEDKFAILLTNRVHPTSGNTKLLEFRPKFHDEC